MSVKKNPDMGSLLMPNATVPVFQCPTGTKMHILNLGTLRLDHGWYVPCRPEVLEGVGRGLEKLTLVDVTG